MSVNGSMMRRKTPSSLCGCWHCVGSKRNKTRLSERREARRDIAEQLDSSTQGRLNDLDNEKV